jgi:hypothetical protein
MHGLTALIAESGDVDLRHIGRLQDRLFDGRGFRVVP